MISELTDDQLALLPAIRDKWMPFCLSTEAADRATAEEGLASTYERAGLKPPAHIVWADSPLAGRVQAASMAVQRERQRGVSDVDDEIWKTLLELFETEGCTQRPGLDCGESVRSQLTEGVQGEIDRQLRAEVAHDTWVDVRDALTDRRVSAEVRSASFRRFTERVWDVLGVTDDDPVPDPVHDVITVYGGNGQHDAWWAAFCEFFEQIGLLASTEPLEPIHKLVRSSGWWWAFEHAAILSERPRVLVLDERERPHCESGPAVEYPDRFGFWAWHGVQVPPGTTINVDSLTLDQIDAEPDGLLRAALINAFGRERYLTAKGAELIHEEGRWGSVYRVTAERECAVLHESGNSSCAFRRVPPFVQTGRQAWAAATGRDLSDNDTSTNSPFGVG